MGEQAQGQEAVRDRGAEGPRGRRLDVDVDPLVVERGVGEGVDAGLVDVEPLAGADLGAGGRGDVVERGEGAHGRTPRRGLVARVLDDVPMTATPHPRPGPRARPRCCCTTTSTVGCGRRRSSSSPRRSATSCPAADAESLGRWFRESADSGSLVRYLETFDHTVAVMQNGPAIARVARECVEDLAADGVVYAEVRYAPEQHVANGLTLDEVVAAVQEGFDAGRGRERRHGSSYASC